MYRPVTMYKCRNVAMAMSMLALTALVSAQITFSRDWSGGKRSAPAAVPLDCTQFTRLCRHFLHDLRQSVMEELSGGAKRRRVLEDSSPVYEDEK